LTFVYDYSNIQTYTDLFNKPNNKLIDQSIKIDIKGFLFDSNPFNLLWTKTFTHNNLLRLNQKYNAIRSAATNKTAILPPTAPPIIDDELSAAF